MSDRSDAGAAVCLVLHAHLPFVRHPEHPRFLEEDWLYEAILEVYLPLLSMLERLREDGIPAPLSLSMSPTLVAMLEDPLLMGRFSRRLDEKIDLLEQEVWRTRFLPDVAPLALAYLRAAREARTRWADVLRGDLLTPFARLARGGAIELLTTAATHAYLPLLGSPALCRAQIGVAIAAHERTFGARPSGFWLPECGYAPEIDAALGEAGVRHFFVDAHAIELATPRPTHAAHAPILTPGGPLAIGRDLQASLDVWSRGEGYPAHPDYRDFHRDIGWDLDLEYLLPYLPTSCARAPLGIKYSRIEGATGGKAPYDPARAAMRAREDARHFLARRRRQAAFLRERDGMGGLVAVPFDAELFGHWWHEGPLFLEELLRAAAEEPTEEPRFRTVSEALAARRRVQAAAPAQSSWGEGGHSAFWLSPENDWIYRRLWRAGDDMTALAGKIAARGAAPAEERALRQAARELLLSQASDWAFILHTRTAPTYAEARTLDHLAAFERLRQSLRDELWRDGGRSDPACSECAWLAEREGRTPLFPELDWTLFCPREGEAT